MLLQSIKLTNLLSFRETELQLRALNVLIGPNASGKSNLVAAIGLLKAAPENLEAAVQRGGGVRQWIHKASLPEGVARIDARIDLGRDDGPLAYSFSVHAENLSLLLEEKLKSGITGDEYFYP